MNTALQALIAARIEAETASEWHPYILWGDTEAQKAQAARANAILGRANIIELQRGNPYAYTPISEMARECAETAGCNTAGRSEMEVVAQALTTGTSEFPNLLVNVARSSMLKGYDASGETYPLWTVPGTLSDFRAAARVGIGVSPALDEVPESARYEQAQLTDRKEAVRLATYGKLFTISRQAIINNNLDHFTKIPLMMGRAAARTVGDLAYAVLTGNPTMGDGVALFHADHSNLLTGAAISSTSIAAMRTAMSQQSDNGVVLGLRPRFIITPIGLEGLARQVADAQFWVGADEIDISRPNGVYRTFDVIAEHRLDVAAPTAWYACADPQLVDTIELSYLDGKQEPTLEQQTKFTSDGAQFKVRIDVAATALEWRALAVNPGP